MAVNICSVDSFMSENWSGPKDCAEYKQNCPIVLNGYMVKDSLPSDYDFTNCTYQGATDQATLRTSVEKRNLEKVCRFCEDGGCGYTVC